MCLRDSARVMTVFQDILVSSVESCLWNSLWALRCRSCLPAFPPAVAGNSFSPVIPVVAVVTLFLRFPIKS